MEADADVEELDTRIVLKLRGATRLKTGPFRGLGLTELGEGAGWTYAVLSTRESRNRLGEVLREYGGTDPATPIDWDHPQSWADLLDTIEDIALYGPDDRYDRELDTLTFDRRELLDVVMWPSPGPADAQTRVAAIENLVRAASRDDSAIRVVAIDPRPQTTVIRVSADRALLDRLLAEPWVERVRPPLRPEVTLADLVTATITVPLPTPDGEPIGIVDGLAVTANPLLHGAVTASKGFPAGHVYGGPDDHGTGVAGMAVWGDLEFLVRRTPPSRTPRPVVNARVLEFNGRNNTVVGQPHVTIAEAIRWLVDEHGVRVVSISINRNEPADGLLPSELTTTLDELARELDVVIVVSTGNRHTDVPASGWLHGYPGYLVDTDAGIAEPADAALAVTVGSLARRDVPGGASTSSMIAIAPAAGPSPFTRSGPTRGKNATGTLKPEFVHHGGNWAHDHQLNQLSRRDPGISVITAIPPQGARFIGVDNGTSYAAPAVAHEVARIATRYPDASANLLRALLALSARVPEKSAVAGIDPLRTCGYGVPDAERILESGGANAILTIEATITTNSVVIHRVPVPYEFAEGASKRLFRVALAFDPPVRRSRREYIAGTMSVELVRGLDEAEVGRHYRLQPSVSQVNADPTVTRLDLPKGRLRPQLAPPPSRVASNTLIRRDFDHKAWDSDDEHYFLVVSHDLSPWTDRQKKQYPTQRYALAVHIADEDRANLDLHNLIRVQLRTRLRAGGSGRRR
ncbi:Uncharacterised protein [Amycolatopsis camponoti]|uniref:Peptidase S8/S53 domain-containing protein n=1 Tax=Amycolatopsis camponoti TaxID=2606593 RepID=A0A6I8M242_9PSEU|nr:S8 family peptidase [Amycolatopsis camponoti]VVJ23870.1 Uncharacterised protein [Amycolatopsis camponoti]